MQRECCKRVSCWVNICKYALTCSIPTLIFILFIFILSFVRFFFSNLLSIVSALLVLVYQHFFDSDGPKLLEYPRRHGLSNHIHIQPLSESAHIQTKHMVALILFLIVHFASESLVVRIYTLAQIPFFLLLARLR